MRSVQNGITIERYAAARAAPEPPPMPLEEARQKFAPMWVVYDHPKDFPNCFVARLLFGLAAAPDTLQADTLGELRGMIRATGCAARLARMFNDDPCIVECWL
jgi:hypothetical protein